jgi:hypothetical protein
MKVAVFYRFYFYKQIFWDPITFYCALCMYIFLKHKLLAIEFYQCCGFVTFWDGSGSADPTPDPARILVFSSVTFKICTKTVGIKGYLPYYFCLIIEGAGAGPRTNGSGSGSRRSKTHTVRSCGSDPQHWI